MIALLLLRLVAGEFAHAMPHHGDAGALDSAPAHVAHVISSAAVPDCADHQPASAHAHASHADASPASANDCCEKGGCECACAQSSAFVVPALAATALGVETLLSSPVATFPRDRLNVVFRPPV